MLCVPAPWLQSTPSLQRRCIRRERAGEARASQGMRRHKGWQLALPFAVPTGGTNASSDCDTPSPRQGRGEGKSSSDP